MNKFNISKLTFVHRNTYVHGNADGVIVAIPLTVWHYENYGFILVPDDPAHAPHLKRYTRIPGKTKR